MAKLKINADRVGWVEPNPVKDQPEFQRTAGRGEIVEVPDAEAERLKSLRVRTYYTDPVTGVAAGAYREEPPVLDASEAEAAEAADTAEAQARVAELQAELATAQARLPLVPTAVAADSSLLPVELSPAQGAPRLVVDEPRKLATEAPTPVPPARTPSGRGR